MRVVVGVAAVVGVLIALSSPSASSQGIAHHRSMQAQTESRSTRTGLTNVLSNYRSVIREAKPDAQGYYHIDTPATIAALKKQHINTYAFLVYGQPDWQDLVNDFLPAAEKAQINVWPYLVPPTECCSEPYEEDYVAWAKAIARLSLQYPNLNAWVIDDFAFNLKSFTPDYLRQITEAAHSINPRLPFFPILYDGQYTQDFLNAYGPYIQGAVFPYEGNAYHDLNDLQPFISQLDSAVGAMRGLSKRIYLMPYVTKLSSSPNPPTASTFSSMVQTGLHYMDQGKLDGIVLFVSPLVPQDESCSAPVFDHVLSFRLPWNTETPGGDTVEASQQIAVDPNASSYTVNFHQQDSFITYPKDLGFYVKQLLVDGTVVWQEDAAADPSYTWTEQTVDLTQALQGKTSATLTFRLANPKGVSDEMIGGLIGIVFSIAQVNGTGVTITNGDFTTNDGWTFSSTSSLFDVVYRHDTYTCDPQREQHIDSSLKRSFGPHGVLYRALAATGLSSGQKESLISTARKALGDFEAGNVEDGLSLMKAEARKATAMGLPILAEQARLVIGDYQGST